MHDRAGTAVHRLFFAVFPDRPALAAIARLSERLRAESFVRGRWLAPEKYHLTVRFLGDFDDAGAANVVARAKAAGTGLCAAAFDLALDRVATFRGRFRAPCVLRCTRQSDAVVCALWRKLGRNLQHAGFEDSDDRRFQPHLTIAYADRPIQTPIAIEPIEWRVAGFALVDSHLSQHAVVTQWPLQC